MPTLPPLSTSCRPSSTHARRAAGLPDVVLQHVRGHSGHVLNAWADERAVRAAEHAAEGKESAWSSLGSHPKLDVAAAPKNGR